MWEGAATSISPGRLGQKHSPGPSGPTWKIVFEMQLHYIERKLVGVQARARRRMWSACVGSHIFMGSHELLKCWEQLIQSPEGRSFSIPVCARHTVENDCPADLEPGKGHVRPSCPARAATQPVTVEWASCLSSSCPECPLRVPMLTWA